jgi:CRP/FNR family transcriptional regulator
VPAVPAPSSKLSVERLGACELFSAFSAAARKRVLELSRLCGYSPGQQIFAEGEACDALYLLLEGTVKVHKVSPAGKEQVLRQFKPSQVFGVQPVFVPNGRYPASAVAVDEAQVLRVPKPGLIKLLKTEPELMLKALGQVSIQLQYMVHLAESMSLATVPQRVAEELLALAKAAGGPKPGQILVLDRSQSQLAAELGTVREVLGRTLHKLRKQGILAVEGRRITLLDPARLATLESD